MDTLPFLPEQLATPRPPFEFHLLGHPNIDWNHHPLDIPRRTVRALIYRLACESEPVPRDHLNLLFWPDIPEVSARRNLSHHLTHLRRALPLPELLMADAEGVWLQPDLFWCDVLEFKKLSDSLSNNTDMLRTVAGLYNGPFLEGFDLPGCPEFEQWCLVERSSFEHRYLKILGHLVQHCTDQGEISQAIRYAKSYLDIDPLYETIHQKLIQLFAASGDRRLALQQFDICSAILERELGVGPLPETISIHRAVQLGQDRFPIPTRRDDPQLPSENLSLIGRENEMAFLDQAFDGIHTQLYRMVLISGEAGIGKSHLIQEFCRRRRAQVRVLYGAAVPGDQAIPYRPILECLRDLLGLKDKKSGQMGDPKPPIAGFVEPVWLAEISRLLPEIHMLYPDLPPPLPVDPEIAHARLFDGISRVMLACAEIYRPILFCLDDLQWMDTSSRALLVHIVRRLMHGRHPILILGAYRSEDANEVLELRQALMRMHALSELKVTGLDEAAMQDLMCHMIGWREGQEFLIRRLHQATGGNPFYLIEIIRQFIEIGKFEKPLTDTLHFTLPESVQDAIQVRLESLSPIALQVLEAGAIIGRSFGPDFLRLTAGRSHAETLIAVKELSSRMLLVEDHQEYTFIHDLTRQHVLESLDPVRSKLLHRRAGKSYQRLEPDAHAALAHHFEMGGDRTKAMQYHRQAAAHMGTLYAWQKAEFHQGRYLTLSAQVESFGTRTELIRQHADVLSDRAFARYLMGKTAERDADLEALTELGETSNNDQVRLQAILHSLRYSNLDGDYPLAIRAARKGLALVDASPVLSQDTQQRTEVRSRLLAQLGYAYDFLGKPKEALDALQETGIFCKPGINPEVCGRVQHILGYVYLHLGEYQHSLECQQQAYACHLQAGDTLRVVWELFDLGDLHKQMGNLPEACRLLEEGLVLSRRIGAQQAEAHGLTLYGDLCLYRGDYAAAVGYYQQVMKFQRSSHSEHVMATTEAGMGFALYHLGSYTQSQSWLASALQRTLVSGQRWRSAKTLIQLGLVDMAEGCLPIARQHLEEGLKLAKDSLSRECLVAGLIARARLERLGGDLPCSRARAMDALCEANQLGLSGCQMWAEIEAGLAALAAGDLDCALEHTQRATSLAPKAGQDWIGAEEAYRTHALALRALEQDKAADDQEICAREIIQSKAKLIPDRIQRRRYLAVAG